MHESSTSPDVPSNADSEVELLARESDTPVDAVRELYRIEREKLEHSARIKTFVPVLAWRRVKEPMSSTAKRIGGGWRAIKSSEIMLRQEVCGNAKVFHLVK